MVENPEISTLCFPNLAAQVCTYFLFSTVSNFTAKVGNTDKMQKMQFFFLLFRVTYTKKAKLQLPNYSEKRLILKPKTQMMIVIMKLQNTNPKGTKRVIP